MLKLASLPLWSGSFYFITLFDGIWGNKCEIEKAEKLEYKFEKALVPVLSIRKKARKKKAKQIETSWGTKNLLPTVMRSFCAMLLPLLTKDPR